MPRRVRSLQLLTRERTYRIPASTQPLSIRRSPYRAVHRTITLFTNNNRRLLFGLTVPTTLKSAVLKLSARTLRNNMTSNRTTDHYGTITLVTMKQTSIMRTLNMATNAGHDEAHEDHAHINLAGSELHPSQCQEPIKPVKQDVSVRNSNVPLRPTTLSSAAKTRLDQQKRFMDSVREPVIKELLSDLREAVQALKAAQYKAGDKVRMHLFVESESIVDGVKQDPLSHHKSVMSFYNFFSPTFIADTDFKKSIVHDLTGIFEKFRVLHASTNPDNRALAQAMHQTPFQFSPNPCPTPQPLLEPTLSTARYKQKIDSKVLQRANQDRQEIPLEDPPTSDLLSVRSAANDDNDNSIQIEGSETPRPPVPSPSDFNNKLDSAPLTSNKCSTPSEKDTHQSPQEAPLIQQQHQKTVLPIHKQPPIHSSPSGSLAPQ